MPVNDLTVRNNFVTVNKSTDGSPLKLIIVNCQSLIAKKASFSCMINEHNPDFIAGTESWLSPNIHNSEIFPPTYNSFRRDRDDNHGGVFIAYKSTFICEEIPVSTTREIVACRIHLKTTLSS